MIEMTYRFEPADLHAYNKVATARIEAAGSGADGNWGIALVGTFGVAALIAAASIALPALTSRPFAMPEFLAGLASGVVVVAALMWRRYFRLLRRATRTDGPTLAEHHLSIAEDGLRSSTRFTEVLYRWPVFEGASVAEGVVVLWTEPGAGVLIPLRSFASPEAEQAFLEAVRNYIAEAEAGTASGALA